MIVNKNQLESISNAQLLDLLEQEFGQLTDNLKKLATALTEWRNAYTGELLDWLEEENDNNET